MFKYLILPLKYIIKKLKKDEKISEDWSDIYLSSLKK
jgi:hypothetical protein